MTFISLGFTSLCLSLLAYPKWFVWHHVLWVSPLFGRGCYNTNGATATSTNNKQHWRTFIELHKPKYCYSFNVIMKTISILYCVNKYLFDLSYMIKLINTHNSVYLLSTNLINVKIKHNFNNNYSIII